MAPQPPEDVNFPDLFEQIIEPLLKLVSELFTLLWSYVSGLIDFVVSHPIMGTPVLAIGFVVLSGVFGVPKDYLLRCLEGFQARGVLRNPSAPPNYQSTNHGDNAPKAPTQPPPAKGAASGAASSSRQ